MSENEKEKLFRRLIRQANQALLLERMRALGFWPYGQSVPPDPPEEAEEREQIEKGVAALMAQRKAVKNPEAALAKERARRWEESKERRAAAKKAREETRAKRRAEWEAFRQQTLVHAGLGVSAGLQDMTSDVDALRERGLPIIHDSRELAAAMGIPLARLRWLTYHRRGATLVHYHRFQIPKKSGGMRSISAPKPALAAAQDWVLRWIFQPLAPEPEAHGFVRNRSIVTNAAPHVGRAVVINLDVKDFFPSITFRRVKGLFYFLGYSEHVATVLALLCTEAPRLPVSVDGKRIYIALGERRLPQGACTSPAITNAICRALDRRLAGVARRHGFTYTRYADDLTFSGDETHAIRGLLWSVRMILADEGLTEHEAKTRVMRRGRRQEVTGVTVNEKLGVSRQYVRELRAILHNAARFGLASQNRHGHHDFAAYLRGRVEFAGMVDPSRAPALRAALARALARK
jgi:retron-type reverse transcriptase